MLAGYLPDADAGLVCAHSRTIAHVWGKQSQEGKEMKADANTHVNHSRNDAAAQKVGCVSKRP